MQKTVVVVLLAMSALPAFASEERPAAVPAAAGEARVIHLDANTQIRFDPRLRALTGTDTAAAGASGSMEERHRLEMKSGAAGPDDEVKSSLPPSDAKAPKKKR